MMDLVFSVSELNRAVNARLSRDPELSRVRVRGEISGLKKYPSGHSYFTLKDEEASVSCVLFRQSAGNAPPLREGMQVVLLARPNLYDKTGRFQLLVDQAREEGVGDLYRRFLDLKESLEKEGIFDQKNKKPIPYLPGRIVAVTSEAGAVIRDMIHVIRRRFPGMRLILIPVPVQGQGAELEIAAAIELANILELGDVIIVGRGGGSLEDLQPFNEEVTARAIAAPIFPSSRPWAMRRTSPFQILRPISGPRLPRRLPNLPSRSRPIFFFESSSCQPPWSNPCRPGLIRA